MKDFMYGERKDAIAILLVAELCGKWFNEKLRGVVSDSDASGIEPTNV